jgi:hypothetical protein
MSTENQIRIPQDDAIESCIAGPAMRIFALIVVLCGCTRNGTIVGNPGGNDAGDSGVAADGHDVGSFVLPDLQSNVDFVSSSSCSTPCGYRETCLDGRCIDACAAAEQTKNSVGCEYFATYMDLELAASSHCFAAIVTNAWKSNAHVTIDYGGVPVDLSRFAKVPNGAGLSLSYGAFDPDVGLVPEEALIVFLADAPNGSGARCPSPAARGQEVFFTGTGRGKAFHIKTDVPVVAYQILPYGGGSASVTGASLLIPTSAWGLNYIAVDAYRASYEPLLSSSYLPSLNLVAAEDGTTVTVQPKVAIVAASGVAGTAAGVPVVYSLDAGEMLQITQNDELTGSPIQSNKPIGLWAGHQAMRVPLGMDYADHGEQQIPPVRAWGSEYVAVIYRPRTGAPESPPWRIIGAVDGTRLSFDPPISGAPASINLGDVVEMSTGTPFIAHSQDGDHPFLLLGYMTGSGAVATGSSGEGYGDPDIVRIVPPAQYLDHYVFFTDPTYPETNLVVVRRRGASVFAPVELDCAGELAGFQPVGSSGQYEYVRIDLVRHNWQPQGRCDNGRHSMSSTEAFGLWVWGWGTPETDPVFTANVSYGYPAGEGLKAINEVVVPIIP